MTDNKADCTDWTVVMEWWDPNGYQRRIRVKEISGSAHWNVQKQSRGPGGSYVVDWTAESRSQPSICKPNTDSSE